MLRTDVLKGMGKDYCITVPDYYLTLYFSHIVYLFYMILTINSDYFPKQH
jgi:hypothetical protein